MFDQMTKINEAYVQYFMLWKYLGQSGVCLGLVLLVSMYVSKPIFFFCHHYVMAMRWQQRCINSDQTVIIVDHHYCILIIIFFISYLAHGVLLSVCPVLVKYAIIVQRT